MKKIFVFILLFFLFISKPYAFDFDILSDKVIVVNMNEDKILYSKNIHDKTFIASLTKIVTAITVLDSGVDVNSRVVITSDMLSNLNGYAKAGFKVGDNVSVLELLYAMMNPSGADASQALAIYIGGNIDNFVNLMNMELKKVGVKNTHFTNVYGKDTDGNYSTAYDLYRILRYCLINKTFKEIFESKSFYVDALLKNVDKSLYANSLKYGIDSSIIMGSKTGYTHGAGRCLASISYNNGVSLMIINLNADENSINYILDPVNLYNYYYNNYDYITIAKKGDILHTLKVKYGIVGNYDIMLDSDIKLYLNKKFDSSKLNIVYKGVDQVNSDIKLGDKIGVIDFVYDGDLLYTYNVTLNKRIWHYNPFIILFAIIIIIILKKII